MSQYRTGTVTLVNGDQTVTGTGTEFLANVAAGDIWHRPGDGVPYVVGSVTDDTHLELSTPYAGTGGSGIAYAVTTSLTPNISLPYPEAGAGAVTGDRDTATILKRMALVLDTQLAALVTASAGAVLFAASAGAITSDPTNFYYDDTQNVLRMAGGGTPAALASGQLQAFGKTTTGATLQGYGSTYDVTLANRAGTTVLGIGPNTTAATFVGTVTGASFIPTATTTNGLGLVGANNPGLYASSTKVIDWTSAGATITGTQYVSGKATFGVSAYTNAPSSDIGIYHEGSRAYGVVSSVSTAGQYAFSAINAATSGDAFLLSFRTGATGGTERSRISYDVTNSRMNATGAWNYAGAVTLASTLGVTGAVTLSNATLNVPTVWNITSTNAGAVTTYQFLNSTADATGVRTRVTLPVFNGTSGTIIENVGNSVDGYKTHIKQAQGSGVVWIDAGSSTAGQFQLSAAGNVTLAGDLALNGGDMTTSAATFNMMTATATTVNAFSAATALSFGAATGTSTFGNTVVTPASTTGRSGLRLPHGAAPSAPVDGDAWTTTAGLYIRINGATVGPLS